MNYYEMLGVGSDSTMEQIKQAFRRLALEHHPDRNPSRSAEDFFKAVNQAYSILHDPQTRKTYDAQLGRGLSTALDLPQIIARKAGSVLEAIAVGAAAAGTMYRRAKRKAGRDLRYRLRVSAAELKGAAEVSVRYLRPVACWECLGAGVDSKGRTCDACKGEGRVERMQTASFNIPSNAGHRAVLKLSGYGEEGLFGSPGGNLLVELESAEEKS